MRDVASMVRGERVTVWANGVPQGAGSFQAFERGKVTINADDLGDVTFHLGSWFTATDGSGRELGLPVEDPVLVGDPPDLE